MMNMRNLRTTASRQAIAAVRRLVGADARRFAERQDGAMTVYMILMFLLICGFVGLVMDSSRGYVVHTNLQNYVDDVAIAAANELNGEPGAIARAQRVVDEAGASGRGRALHYDNTTISTRGDRFNVVNAIYTSGAPRTVNGRIDIGHAESIKTASDEDATHVVVVAQEVEVPITLLRLANGGLDEAFRVNAVSAARLSEACFATEPLFAMCAPAGMAPDEIAPGTQIQLFENIDPLLETGEFGIVTDINDDPNGTCSAYSGDAKIECLLAINEPSTACEPNLIDITADIDGDIDVGQAINTRFNLFGPDLDAWAASVGVSGDTNTNTARGYECDGTINDTPTTRQNLPFDACLADQSCGYMSGPAPLSDLEDYWQTNWGEPLPAVSSVTGGPINTSFLVYLEEAALGYRTEAATARATCHPAGAASQQFRRTFEVAVIDCNAQSGLPDQNDVEVLATYDVFATKPLSTSVNVFDTTFDGSYSYTDAAGTVLTGTMTGGDVVSTTAQPYTYGSPGVYDPYKDEFGLEIFAVANGSGLNAPVLYNSQPGEGQPVGEDPDLISTDRGNVLMIQESNNRGPDDNAQGGVIVFSFDAQQTVRAIELFDGEETDNKILLWPTATVSDTMKTDIKNDQGVATSSADFIAAMTAEAGVAPCELSIPQVGDGGQYTLTFEDHPDWPTCVANGLTIDSIQTVAYHMTHGSGAVDGLYFDAVRDQEPLSFEVVGAVGDDDRRVVMAPVLTD